MRNSPSFLPEAQKASLKEQIQGVSKMLGTGLLPPDLGENVLNQSMAVIRERYRYRLGVFLRLIGAIKRGEESPAAFEFSKKIQALNNLVQYLQKESADEEQGTLHLYQIDVFETLINFLEAGNDSGYIKLPTGYGKTVIFTEFIEALGVRSLIVVPTQDLVEQTEEKIQEFARDLDVGKIYSRCREHGQDVTIITYASFVKQIRSGQLTPEDYDCIILDEVHRGLTQGRMDAINRFGHAIKIGFSATPDYSEEKGTSKLLDRMIYEKKTVEAIEEGQLCSVRSVFAKTNIDLSSVQLTTSGEYSAKDLAKAVNIASRNQAAVNLYKKIFSGQRGVSYCVGVKHAQDLAQQFRDAGVKAAAVWGDMDPKERRDTLAAAKNGEIEMLCNADLLIEGYDDPAVSICLNLRPTTSRVIAEQRGGRVLRVNRNDLDKMSYVVDFIDQGIEERKMITFPDILFTDVLGKVQVLSPLRKNPPPDLPSDITIEGLQVIVDIQKMAELLRKRQIKQSASEVDGISEEKISELTDQGWEIVDDPVLLFNICKSPWEKYLDVQFQKGNEKIIRLGKTKALISPDLFEQLKGAAVRSKEWMSLLDFSKQTGIDVLDLYGYVEAKAHPYINYRIFPRHHTLSVDPDFILNQLEDIAKSFNVQISNPSFPELEGLPGYEAIKWETISGVLTIKGKDRILRHVILEDASGVRRGNVKQAVLKKLGYRSISYHNRQILEICRKMTRDMAKGIIAVEQGGSTTYYIPKELTTILYSEKKIEAVGRKSVQYRYELEDTGGLDKVALERTIQELDEIYPDLTVQDSLSHKKFIIKVLTPDGYSIVKNEIERIKKLRLASDLFATVGIPSSDTRRALSTGKMKWPSLVHFKEGLNDAYLEPGFEEEFMDSIVEQGWLTMEEMLKKTALNEGEEIAELLEALRGKMPNEYGLKFQVNPFDEKEYFSPLFVERLMALNEEKSQSETAEMENYVGAAYIQQKMDIDFASAENVLVVLAKKHHEKVIKNESHDDRGAWLIDPIFFESIINTIEAPEYWQTMEELALEHEVPDSRIKRILASIPDRRSGMREFFSPKTGNKLQYLSPDLIDQIAEQI